MTTAAFVTKSYTPDRERCELLCRSIQLLAPEMSHWIIVDARDRSAFEPLEGPTTRIVTTEELLPRWLRRLALHRIGMSKNVWAGPRTPPVRGWLVQQLAKLAVGLVASEDVLIHADSDVVLVRRFDEAALSRVADAPGPFRVPAAVDRRLPDHVRWHRTAEWLLRIEERPLPLADYIGGLVPWHREIAVALLAEIERHSGRDWMRTVARERHVSEYILYGRFVDDVLGASTAAAAPSLCRCYWAEAPMTKAELRRFIDGAAPTEVGVMVSAKAGMAASDYAGELERRWAAVRHETGHARHLRRTSERRIVDGHCTA